ncbi:acyltransferase family protein [Modestobacter lacusdianchii]
MAQHRSARLDEFPSGRNSLSAIRWGLAVLVIVAHSFPLGGFAGDVRLGDMELDDVAVAGFFALSGWLIIQSRLSTDLATYAWRRVLRIYPGYLAVGVVVAFFFAPIGSLLGGGPWSVGDGVRYVLANDWLRVGAYNVGQTPMNVPFPGAWNGSLWTLYHEALCYVLIGAIVSVVPRRHLTSVVVLAWAGLSFLAWGGGRGWFEQSATLQEFVSLAPYFFAGAALFVLRGRVPLHGAIALAACLTSLIVLHQGLDAEFVAMPLAYCLLYLGVRLPFHRFGRRHDLSYGMYIYAFPVQQTLVLLGVASWGLVPYMVCSVLATVPFAALSWFAVERPAQRRRRLLDRCPDRAARPGRRGSVHRPELQPAP